MNSERSATVKMNSNFLKDYMDLDEFMAVKALCNGLSRTESDYSDDEIDEDFVEFTECDDNLPPFMCGLSTPQFSTEPQLSPGPSLYSNSDEGRGESVTSENPASLSSSESLISNESDKTSRKRKRKAVSEKQQTEPKKRKRNAAKTSNSTEPGKKKDKGPETVVEVDGVSYSYHPGAVSSRSCRRSVDNDDKDDKYWERRRKNNQAAKRSRDLRRQKEMCVANRAALLEEENKQLREEVEELRNYLKTLNKKVEQGSVHCK